MNKWIRGLILALISISAVCLWIDAFGAPVKSVVAGKKDSIGEGNPKTYDAEVEYLQSTGAQYINTGIKCEYGMAFHVNFLPSGNDTWTIIAGVSSNVNITFGAIREWSYYGGSYVQGGIGTGSTVYWQDCTFSATQRRCQSAQGSFNYSWTTAPFSQLQIPLYVFARNNKGAAAGFYKGKIASFSITLDSDVIIDLIPVRVGTEGAMYDRVSGQLFRNQGADTFIIGPDKQGE